MGVDPGRLDIGMAKQLLDGSDVGARFQKMGREAVAQYVWRDTLQIRGPVC